MLGYELERAEWQVAVARRHVAQQKEIISKMHEIGISTTLAERVLATLISLQEEHEAHRVRLLDNAR